MDSALTIGEQLTMLKSVGQLIRTLFQVKSRQ